MEYKSKSQMYIFHKNNERNLSIYKLSSKLFYKIFRYTYTNVYSSLYMTWITKKEFLNYSIFFLIHLGKCQKTKMHFHTKMICLLCYSCVKLIDTQNDKNGEKEKKF